MFFRHYLLNDGQGKSLCYWMLLGIQKGYTWDVIVTKEVMAWPKKTLSSGQYKGSEYK